jgi:hypothetical protein
MRLLSRSLLGSAPTIKNVLNVKLGLCDGSDWFWYVGLPEIEM